MNKQDIIKELEKVENQQNVENFASYCIRLKLEKKPRTNDVKNPWMQKKTAQDMAKLYLRVENEGLVFDGKHVTLNSRGISYDYVAYKNKMLIAYPETKMNFSAVFAEDDFSFETTDGRVSYKHTLSNPFSRDETRIIGAYCVIKNRRGEFLTTLDKAEIHKHRAVAQTDSIWKQWFIEMVYKTVIKKSCKYHFDDIFQKMEEEDQAQFDLSNPVDVDIAVKQDVEACLTQEELKAMYNKYKGNAAALKLITNRFQNINEAV